MLTRRELLAGAGSAAVALALAGCGGDGRPLAGRPDAPRVAPPPRMRKGVSLIGDVNAYEDALGVRPYLLGGPHPTRYARGGAGNPSGAHVDWLQSMNEPNLAWWPQRSPDLPGGTIAGAVAELARSAATVASEVPGAPGLLLPATADVVGACSSCSARTTGPSRPCG